MNENENPTEGFGWGDSSPQPLDQESSSADNSWDDWSDSTESSSQENSDDSWSNWGDSSDDDFSWDSNTSSNESQSNDVNWGSTTQPQQENYQGWNNTQASTENNFIQPDENWSNQDSSATNDETFDSYMQNNNPVTESLPIKTNFSTKSVAFIIAGVLVVLALVFLLLDNIHIKTKTTTSQETTTTTTQETQTTTTNEQSTETNTTTTQSSSNAVLVEVPDSMSLNYSGDVLTTNGTVIAKLKYVQGHQVLYCIQINIAIGSSSETINYYCNYASFNAVSKGDVVVITYQQVEDSYISVNSISK